MKKICLIDSSAVLQDVDILKELIEEKQTYQDPLDFLIIFPDISVRKLQSFSKGFSRLNADLVDSVSAFLEDLYVHYSDGMVDYVKCPAIHSDDEHLSIIENYIKEMYLKVSEEEYELTVYSCDPTLLHYIHYQKPSKNIFTIIPKKVKELLTEEESFGYGVFEMNDDVVYDKIADISTEDDVCVDDISELKDLLVHPNRFFVVKNGQSKSMVSKVYKKRNKLYIKRIDEISSAFGIKPKNLEQQLVMNLLLDQKVELVSLTGGSGSGKTICAIASGLSQLRSKTDIDLDNGSKKVYDKIIIVRPIVSVGSTSGYLPGDLSEKMAPWMMPIKDNIKSILKKNGSKSKDPNLMFEDGRIEIQALEYIRGRSIEGCFIIIDEAQNMNYHELKTVVTRAGKGSKVVLTGDLDQIDLNLLRGQKSGLDKFIKRMMTQSVAGHIKMIKVERSDLAAAAVSVL